MRYLLLCFFSLSLLATSSAYADTDSDTPLPNATHLIKQALETWRGKSSFSQVRMVIHRPDWQRDSAMQAWTKDMDKSLIRFIEPSKDAGNATLKLDKNMWLYTPKLHRVSKLPNSMMGQSWMGSDFSYNDLAKSDQILTEYSAEITRAFTDSQFPNQNIYQLELFPKPNAPVVWGKEVLLIREDGLLLTETFYDQNFAIVKQLVTLQESVIDNKPYPVKMRMQKHGQPDHWTEIITEKLWFDLPMPANTFTQTYLKSPRKWQPDSPSQLSDSIVDIQQLELEK